ncbi:MAG: alpha/beta hydrolase [Bacteroidetes bacterium]|nr:alpha/beta hydrolase [Bacteroidota bacterium]
MRKLFMALTAGFLSLCFFSCMGSKIEMGSGKYFAVKENGDTLYYYIGRETSGPKNKLLVMIQGSGRESIVKRFGWGAEAALYGYDVLYLEKFAFDDSAKFRSADCRERRLSDISFVIDYAAKNDYSGKLTGICLFADSEGGELAPAIACANPLVKKLIVVGNGGLTGVEKTYILLEKEKKTGYAGYLTLSGINSKSDLDSLINRIRENPAENKSFLGCTYKYWNSYLFADIDSDYEKLNVPVLVIMGEKDFSVPCESALHLKEKFTSHKNITVEIIPGLNHSLIDEKGEKHFAKVLREFILPWFENTGG